MAIFPKNDDQKAETVSAPTSAAATPPFDVADFKIYAGSKITIDPETRMAEVSVPLQKNVTVRVDLPEPLLAAWGIDNAAGKLLAEAGNLKV